MQSLLPDPPRPSTPLLPGYIQPTFNHALRVWWAFYWPTELISAFLVFLLVSLMKSVLPSTKFFDEWALVFGLSVLAIYALVGVFIMQYILHKNFRHFRIRLLTRWRAGEPQQPVDPTFTRALRVWWTYIWRTFVYYFIALAVSTIPATALLAALMLNHDLAKIAPDLLKELLRAGISLFVIHSYILDEDMGDFRVTLLPRDPTPNPIPNPTSDPGPAKI